MERLPRHFQEAPPSLEMQLPGSPQWSLLSVNLFYFITNQNHLQMFECHWCSCHSVTSLFSSTTSEQPLYTESLNLDEILPGHEEHTQCGCLVVLKPHHRSNTALACCTSQDMQETCDSGYLDTSKLQRAFCLSCGCKLLLTCLIVRKSELIKEQFKKLKIYNAFCKCFEGLISFFCFPTLK